jgi:hypothetical protein
MSTPSAAGWIDHFIGVNNFNSWAHFLAFAAVATIPVAAWRQRTNQLLSLIFIFVGIAIELMPSFVPGAFVRPQNAPADLFGVGAGILLGLNLRMLRTASRVQYEKDLGMYNSKFSQSETTNSRD